MYLIFNELNTFNFYTKIFSDCPCRSCFGENLGSAGKPEF